MTADAQQPAAEPDAAVTSTTTIEPATIEPVTIESVTIESVTIEPVTIDAVTVGDESSWPLQAQDALAPIDAAWLARLATFLLPRLRLHPMCELAITLVDAPRMTELHEEWMDEPGPTDVLSFPMDELRSAPEGIEPEPGMLGDIVLCPQVAAAQAADRGRTLEEELAFLVTHGMLHLIGYDHATEAEQARMFTLQDGLLAAWLASEEAASARLEGEQVQGEQVQGEQA